MEIQSVANSSAIVQSFGKAVTTGEVSTPENKPQKEPAIVVNAEQAKQAVDSVNNAVQAVNNNVEFSVDESTGIDVVKVVEKDSKKVIRQLPVDAVLNFARGLDPLQGLLIKRKI
jgi:uncharacterized FlaG/YvyC family protein